MMKAQDHLPLDRLEEIARLSKMLSAYDSGPKDHEHEYHRFMRAIEDITDELQELKNVLLNTTEESDFASAKISIQHIFYHIYDSRYLREIIDNVIETYYE